MRATLTQQGTTLDHLQASGGKRHMDYEYEQHIKRSSVQTEGEGLNVMEAFTKILSLGIADIFDVSADNASNQGSEPPSPTQPPSKAAPDSPRAPAAASKPAPGAAGPKGATKGRKGLGAVKLGAVKASAAQPATVTQPAPSPQLPTSQSLAASPQPASTGAHSRQHAARLNQDVDGSAGGHGKGKPAGILDVLVTGVSSFGMKATNLLNTLDANFDHMFNPIAEQLHQEEAQRKAAEQQQLQARSGPVAAGKGEDHAEATHASALSPRAKLSGGSLKLRSPSKPSAGGAISAERLSGCASPDRSSTGGSGGPARASSSSSSNSKSGRIGEEEEDSVVGAMIRAVGSGLGAASSSGAGAVSINLQSRPIASAAIALATSKARSPVQPQPTQSSQMLLSPGVNASMPAIKAELLRLKQEYAGVVADLERASKQCEVLMSENNKLRGSGSLDPSLNDTVRTQLEALVAEKARLVAENSRLQYENHSLQELLAYTKEHSEVGVEEGAMMGLVLAEGGDETHSCATGARRTCLSLRSHFDGAATGSTYEEVAEVDSYYTSMLASASKREPPPAELEMDGCSWESGATSRARVASPVRMPSLDTEMAASAAGNGDEEQAVQEGSARAVTPLPVVVDAVEGAGREQDGGWGSGDAMSPCTMLQRARTCEMQQGVQQEQVEAEVTQPSVVPAPTAAPAQPTAVPRGKKGKKGKAAVSSSVVVGVTGKAGRGLASVGMMPSSPPDVAGAYDGDAHVCITTLAPASPPADARAVQDVGCA